MLQLDETIIRNVVQQVLAEVGQLPPTSATNGFHGRHGVFTCVDEAVAAASEAFDQLCAVPSKTASESSTTFDASRSSNAKNLVRWK